MEKEFYGNGGFNGNDSDASGKPFPSAFGPQEEQLTEEKGNSSEVDFNSAKGKYENYFLHFSSKL